MDVGLLPVKSLRRAKQRLAPHLDDAERLLLARSLVEDALDLCASADWLEWWVLTDDAEVVASARARGFGSLEDNGGGLNAAMTSAITVLMAQGAGSVIVIPSDLPLAYHDDLRDLSDTGATSDVVVVPSEGDGGTNGLYLRPPDLLEPRFGPGSLKAHVDSAAERGLRCSILPLPQMALDIDTVEDADAYLDRPSYSSSRTRVVLEQLRPARRIDKE
jgi:2-phospho-L-lactate guanylyltransferase